MAVDPVETGTHTPGRPEIASQYRRSKVAGGDTPQEPPRDACFDCDLGDVSVVILNGQRCCGNCRSMNLASRKLAQESRSAPPLDWLERDYLTPLQRFVQRSRVKPTDGQIEFALEKLQALRNALRADPALPKEQEAM